MNENNKVVMETETFSLEKENETNNMKSKLNRSNNDNKKKLIIYISLGVLLLTIISITIYLVTSGKKDNSDKEKEHEVVNKEEQKEDEKEDESTAYVSCDDNTSLLNVRNSPTGDIIDGLSCFKEITIAEELEETENCKKWYKINYTKRGSNYTGYACGTYINKVGTVTKDKELVKELIDKANDYYENNVLKSYCGKSIGETKNIEYKEGDNSFTGYYVKSQYKTLSELKDYLLTFLDESLISPELKLSDINNKKMYDDYYEIDGNLYCRNYSGKGWLTRYTGNYDIEISNISSNKITGRISYEYLTEESTCDIKNLSKCTNSNFKYKLGDFTIKQVNNGHIITDIDFHE